MRYLVYKARYSAEAITSSQLTVPLYSSFITTQYSPFHDDIQKVDYVYQTLRNRQHVDDATRYPHIRPPPP